MKARNIWGLIKNEEVETLLLKRKKAKRDMKKKCKVGRWFWEGKRLTDNSQLQRWYSRKKITGSNRRSKSLGSKSHQVQNHRAHLQSIKIHFYQSILHTLHRFLLKFNFNFSSAHMSDIVIITVFYTSNHISCPKDLHLPLLPLAYFTTIHKNAS